MMLVSLLVFFLIAADYCSVEAAVFYSPNAEDPDNPGHCLDDKDNSSHPLGSTWEWEGECVQLSCSGAKGKGRTINGMGCGTIRAEGMVCEYDLSKKYPECCPHNNCVPKSASDKETSKKTKKGKKGRRRL